MDTLFTELQNDPASLGYMQYIAASNDQAVADLINNATVPVLGLMPRASLAIWAAGTGMRAVFEDQAADPNSALRSSALSIIDVLRGAAGGIDMSLPANADGMTLWVASGLLSASDKASFDALATSDVARSIVVCGRLITSADVAATVRDAEGNSLMGL